MYSAYESFLLCIAWDTVFGSGPLYTGCLMIIMFSYAPLTGGGGSLCSGGSWPSLSERIDYTIDI